MSDNAKIQATLGQMAEAVKALAEATQTMAQAIERMNAPKEIVRGEDGRPAGVRIVESKREAS